MNSQMNKETRTTGEAVNVIPDPTIGLTHDQGSNSSVIIDLTIQLTLI